MEDIDIARYLMEEKKSNLVIVKNGRVLFTSAERGIAPFIHAIEGMGKELRSAAVADRILGLAVAMLCLHAGIKSVYGQIASQPALDLLKASGVTAGSKNVVPDIFNYDGTDLCPFEKLARNSRGAAQFYTALKAMYGGLDDADETLP